MRQLIKSLRSSICSLMLVTTMTIPVLAQTSGIPEELLNNSRRQKGDSLVFCNDANSRLRDFDRDVAQAIADALFLKADFKEGFGGFPLSGDGFLQELQIAMTNDCDVMMGLSVQEESAFPDWAAMTRPYVSLPYVMAVNNKEWKSLSDIPFDRMLGTAMQSMGEMVYITWAQQQPEAKRWVRLPYADMDLMVKRLNDERLAGILLWQPTYAQLKKNNPEAKELHPVDLKPLPITHTKVGALVDARDSFLRTEIDQAIDALAADGTIAKIMEKYGYEGVAGDSH
ncbi:substrate-binding periplasmic protein [Paenochrobactrum sp. BZR 588]|uniref:substrate-binding periplasmic protein n=1 Tax=Paenochrobactrum TaxID=999488 RepID=UPI0035BBA26F